MHIGCTNEEFLFNRIQDLRKKTPDYETKGTAETLQAMYDRVNHHLLGMVSAFTSYTKDYDQLISPELLDEVDRLSNKCRRGNSLTISDILEFDKMISRHKEAMTA